jgi:DNA-binding NarL/FixJ family response regulator
MPIDLARTLFVKAQIERRLRKKVAAKDSLEKALAIFENVGASLWAARTRSELDRAGPRRASGDGLSETERRVAELAASGLTNREVAAALLFMSPKTVRRTSRTSIASSTSAPAPSSARGSRTLGASQHKRRESPDSSSATAV